MVLIQNVQNGPALNTGGGFSTPDLMVNFGFESGFGTPGNIGACFTSWTGAHDPDSEPDDGHHVSIDATVAFEGTHSMKYVNVANIGTEGGSHTLSNFSSQDRVWTRFYFKTNFAVDSIWKFHRFYDQNNQNASGGWFMQDGTTKPILGLSFDQEASQTTFDVGIARSEVIDNNWHYLELDAWANGDPTGFPSFACWLDGVQRFLPNGAAGSGASWINGRLNAGERLRSNRLGWIEWIGTLNASNTQTGTIYIDRVGVSSLGRIGP